MQQIYELFLTLMSVLVFPKHKFIFQNVVALLAWRPLIT